MFIMSSAELQAAQGRMGEQWTGIDWTACLRTVRSLQRRIVKSIRTGHWRKVKRLCYLLVQNRQSAETSKRAMSGLSVSDGGGRRPPSPTPRRERNKQQDNECSAPSLELPGFSARRDSSNVAGASVPWAFVMLEPYAGKLARTVLRERGDGDIALLPGHLLSGAHSAPYRFLAGKSKKITGKDAANWL